MVKLNEDLKRMLAGLAYQDAADFLSRSEKMDVLNGGSKKSRTGNHTISVATSQKAKTAKVETLHATNTITTRHIAFISNGDGINSPLDYAIESSQRQNAQIDLLIHGATYLKNITALEKKIRDAGVCFKRIRIEDKAIDSIIEYIAKQPSLVFIIAMPEDTVAKELIEETSSKHCSRIHTPLVLIRDEIIPGTREQTAA